MIENGELSDPNNWFFSGLKGKLAEFNSKDWLESNGFTDITFPPTEINPGWDIRAIDSDGQEIFISVKTGGIDPDSGVARYAYDVMGEMDANPTFDFMVGSEVHDVIADSRPDLVDRILTDIGPDYELVHGTTDGLNTLSDNMGIDVPDGVVDIIPYAAAIMAGARLVYSVIKTEREFKAADRTTRNKIQVVQSLTVMSRFGVTNCLCNSRRGRRSSDRKRGAGGRQPDRWHCRRDRRRNDGQLPQPTRSTPHAQPCAEHHRADQRRPVLLQEQAARRHCGLELPIDRQGTRSHPHMIVRATFALFLPSGSLQSL